jgi:hypothetical protein
LEAQRFALCGRIGATRVTINIRTPGPLGQKKEQQKNKAAQMANANQLNYSHVLQKNEVIIN